VSVAGACADGVCPKSCARNKHDATAVSPEGQPRGILP
jgi:hypothetical protein